MKNTLLIFLSTILWGCNACHNTTPLFPKDNTNLNERNNRLFVFVGEKISVKNEPLEPGTMDGKFTARYKILERVYGHYENDIIEFTAYDHYGIPPFSKFNNVILFVSEYKGKYYHEKYLFNDVYKTKNGRWAGSYDMYDYSHVFDEHTTVKPEKIDFVEVVSYPTKIKFDDGTIEERSYPEPYFKTVGDKAIAVYGNYIEELFQLKKEGILTARELFGNKGPEEAVVVQDVQLEEIKVDSAAELAELKFIAFWKSFYRRAVKTRDVQQLKKQALDSIRICDSLIPTHQLDKNCIAEILDKPVIRKLGDSSSVEYSWYRMDTTHLFADAKKKIIKGEDGYRLRGVKIQTDIEDYRPVYLSFAFLETKNGYRLFGFGYAKRRKCCR